MRIKISPEEPIIFFVRVKGPKGVREFRAVFDTGSAESLIPVQDARSLGYNAYFDPISNIGTGTPVITKSDVFETDEIVLEEISVADITAKNVKAIAYNMPGPSGIEAVLGMSFIGQFKSCIDGEQGYLTIESTHNKPGS
jgi:predicted aspartyl protease